MMMKIATSLPFRLLSRGIDRAEFYWTAWRTYCRIRNLFPDAKNLSFSLSTMFKYVENISIGDHVMIGPLSTIGAHSKVVLEDYVRISQGVLIETASLDLTQPLPYPHVSRPITLKRGVWVGAGAMVLGGVTVGEYSVIGAGAVVTKDVPPHSIVVGASPRLLPGPKAARG
ncbi:acyltransferase [Sphingomonas sp. KR3-1]|uniref:acyltransferase n=1 Tax=Sphingomonas sp. KR3-1 TaxID=3156611 RepID=UPI0032B58B46